VDPDRFQCGSGSSFLSPCGSGSREPNNADPDPDPGQTLKSHIFPVSTAGRYKEMSSVIELYMKSIFKIGTGNIKNQTFKGTKAFVKGRKPGFFL
jgi:hypothetical protein